MYHPKHQIKLVAYLGVGLDKSRPVTCIIDPPLDNNNNINTTPYFITVKIIWMIDNMAGSVNFGWAVV